MDKKSIDRINELAREAKIRPLTEEELAEQANLRSLYLQEFRAALRGKSTQDSSEK